VFSSATNARDAGARPCVCVVTMPKLLNTREPLMLGLLCSSIMNLVFADRVFVLAGSCPEKRGVMAEFLDGEAKAEIAELANILG
jgi:hypothetical protein